MKHISYDIETTSAVCIMPAAGHWAFPHTRCVMILYEAHYTLHIWRIFHWKIFLSHFKCCPINSKIVMIQNIAYGATACCCCMCINYNDLMVRKKIQSNQLLVILNCEWSIVSKIHSYDGVRKTCQLWKMEKIQSFFTRGIQMYTTWKGSMLDCVWVIYPPCAETKICWVI